MTPHFYDTNTEVCSSTHKPVSAGFSCAVSLNVEQQKKGLINTAASSLACIIQ